MRNTWQWFSEDIGELRGGSYEVERNYCHTKWQSISTCFVRLVEGRISINVEGGFTVGVYWYRNIWYGRKISKKTDEANSAQKPIDAWIYTPPQRTKGEIDNCFFDFHAIGDPPRLMKNPLTDL